MGEGEPDIEFYCNNLSVEEFEVSEESELFDIAEKCQYFESNETEKIYKFSISCQRIIDLGQKIKKLYEAGNYTENSLKMGFGMIAQSAINEYADNYADSQWCAETLGDQEIVRELSKMLKEYFLAPGKINNEKPTTATI